MSYNFKAIWNTESELRISPKTKDFFKSLISSEFDEVVVTLKIESVKVSNSLNEIN